MPFKKGHKKVGGREKGTVNKTTQQEREKIQELLNAYDVKMMLKDLKSLEPKERLDIASKFIEFILPKLQRTEMKAEVENKNQQSITIGDTKITF